MLRLVALASVSLSLVACSSEAVEPGSTNGVDDVKQACELRRAWKNESSSRCSYCLAAAANPPCSCSEEHAFAGLCEPQRDARSNEPSCEGVEQCRFACAAGDCACVEACSAQQAACHRAASAFDGCVVEVCAAECDVD